MVGLAFLNASCQPPASPLLPRQCEQNGEQKDLISTNTKPSLLQLQCGGNPATCSEASEGLLAWLKKIEAFVGLERQEGELFHNSRFVKAGIEGKFMLWVHVCV